MKKGKSKQEGAACAKALWQKGSEEGSEDILHGGWHRR